MTWAESLYGLFFESRKDWRDGFWFDGLKMSKENGEKNKMTIPW